MLNEEQSEPQPQQTALVKQDALPELTTVKNRDGKDRLTARIKGKFTSVAQARVLATQKVVEHIMHKPDENGKNQLEKIITSQAKVCEENADARNLGGISKFLDHVDEISGSKAAREALTKEINAPIVPTVIFIPMPTVPMMERQKEVTQPSWVRSAEVIQQNAAPVQDYPSGYWHGSRNRRKNKDGERIENDRRNSQC
jgi:hypothetical protein